MLKFSLEIRCDNAAFQDESGDDEATALEVARILEKTAAFLRRNGISVTESLPLLDNNGNRVGFATFDDES